MARAFVLEAQPVPQRAFGSHDKRVGRVRSASETLFFQRSSLHVRAERARRSDFLLESFCVRRKINGLILQSRMGIVQNIRNAQSFRGQSLDGFSRLGKEDGLAYPPHGSFSCLFADS